MNFSPLRRIKRIGFTLALLLWQVGAVFAQDAEVSSEPAGLVMLVMFLGIAAMLGVFIVRWSQSTGEDDDES